MNGLRAAAGIGLLVVWGVLIHSQPPTTQLWQGSGRAAPLGLSLLYTVLCLGLIRPRNWNRFGNPLTGQTMLVSMMFFATIIAIAD